MTVLTKFAIAGAFLTAVTLLSFSGRWMIQAYGRARFDAGAAAGRLEGFAEIRRSDASAVQAAIAADRRITMSERKHGVDAARIAAEVSRAESEVKGHEQGTTGDIRCLDAERVRSIENSRDILFGRTPAAGADKDNP